MIKMDLQMFAEDENDVQNNVDVDTASASNDTDNNTMTLPPNWEKLVNWKDALKNIKEAAAEKDRYVTEATKTARENEAKRLKILQDEALSEEARYKAMTKDEQLAEKDRKIAALEAKYQREKDAEELKRTVESDFATKGIPSVFAGAINFEQVNASEIKSIVEMFGEYEYYKAGELEQRINAAVDLRLKQKTPETHIQNSGNDYQEKYRKAIKDKNNIEAIRIKREAFEKKGIIVN
jgi:hypothetical protein